MSKILKIVVFSLLSLALFVACEDEVPEDVFDVKEEQLLMELIEAREDMSISVDAAKKCYIYNLLKTYGPYTFFAPNNDAWQKYFERNGISGIEALDQTVIESIFEYHILPFEMKTLNFQNGLMEESDTTVNGDRLYVDLTGGLDKVLVNNRSLILAGNIEAWNGMLHVVDNVLDPPVMTVSEFLQQEDQYSRFFQFLDKYHITDTLSLLRQSEYPYDRNEFTVMAIPNSQMDKLEQIEDSIIAIDQRYEEYLGADLSYADRVLPNQATQYAASFVLSGIQYTSNLYSSFKKTLGKVPYGDNSMRMKVKVDEVDVILNDQSKLKVENSDLIMKNGVVHQVNEAFWYLEQSPREIIYSAYPHEKWNTSVGANKENSSTNGYLGDDEYGTIRLQPSKAGAKFWVNILDVPAGDYNLTLIAQKGGSKAKILVNNEHLIFDGTDKNGVYDFNFILGNRGRVDKRTPNPCSSSNINLYEIPTGTFHVNEGDDNVEVALEVTYINSGLPSISISAIIIEPAVL